jgi:siroheme synthase (precorrin-2 oxidase/ferrochelatase)
MCHIGTLGAGYQHGKSFRRHLHSLLRKGEKWAWSEIEYYRLQESELLIQKKARTKLAKEIRYRLDDLLFDDIDTSPGGYAG